MTSRSKPRYEADSLVRHVAENLEDVEEHVAHIDDVEDVVEKLNLLTIDLLQKAEAELAYELQAAKTKQRIKEENMQIKVTTALLTKKTEINPLDLENNVHNLAQVIERTQEIAIQSQEIQRRERELDRWRQKQKKLFRDFSST